ncbi:MAG: toll/interleukin-1 receptor domain-containing protein [Candidatus Paceibacterota bacterium]
MKNRKYLFAFLNIVILLGTIIWFILKLEINLKPIFLTTVVGISSSLIGLVLIYVIQEWRQKKFESSLNIFISHTLGDESSDVVRKLYSTLKSDNYVVFDAALDVQTGDYGLKKIEDALEKSDIMLFVINSNKVRESKWIWREVELAIRKEIKILPIIVGDIHVPDFLNESMVLQIEEPFNEKTYKEIKRSIQELLNTEEQLGDRRGVAKSLHQLGQLAQSLGNYDEARYYYEESLEIAKELGDRRGVAKSYGQLGQLAKEQGKYEEAIEFTLIALQIFKELGYPEEKIDLSVLSDIKEEIGEDEFSDLLDEIKGN